MRGGGKGKHWTLPEINRMLDLVNEILPRGQNQWETIGGRYWREEREKRDRLEREERQRKDREDRDERLRLEREEREERREEREKKERLEREERESKREAAQLQFLAAIFGNKHN